MVKQDTIQEKTAPAAPDEGQKEYFSEKKAHFFACLAGSGANRTVWACGARTILSYQEPFLFEFRHVVQTGLLISVKVLCFTGKKKVE
ncbi:MAG: hypothetical protein IJU20_04740 [Clostridia bacterium]|nr:hypothetical protein [Clostridia bacterium]